MRQPGRKSSASLALVVPDVSQQRPKAPRRLTREEKAIWTDLTERFRPDWFQGTEHLLEVYVHSLAMERFIAQLIRRCDPADEKRLGILVRMQRDTATVIASYATKMRITQRSTYDRTAVKLVSTLPQPWELGRGPARPARPIDPRRPFDLPPRPFDDPSAA